MNKDMEDALFDAAGIAAQKKNTTALLKHLGERVATLNELESRKKKLEAQLEVVTAHLRNMTEVELPGLFLEHGITKMQVGEYLLSIDKFYQTSIKDENKAAAFKWLEETNQDAIIKNEFKATFGKGEDERAKEDAARKALKEAGVRFEEKRGVHPMTLKSFVKTAIEEGQQIPMDLFGVYIGNRIKIK